MPLFKKTPSPYPFFLLGYAISMENSAGCLFNRQPLFAEGFGTPPLFPLSLLENLLSANFNA